MSHGHERETGRGRVRRRRGRRRSSTRGRRGCRSRACRDLDQARRAAGRRRAIPAWRRLELLAEQKRTAELTSTSTTTTSTWTTANGARRRPRKLRRRRPGAVAPLSESRGRESAARRAAPCGPPGRAAITCVTPLRAAARRAPPSAATRPARRAASPSARHTTTLTCPVSSSSVTKVTPLAVGGRWRVMTRPGHPHRWPCGASCSSAAVSMPRGLRGARAAAPADAGPA